MTQYHRDQGHSVVEIWECEWKVQRRTVTVPTAYLYPTEHKYRMTPSQVLNAIKSGQLFGAVECDISVPPHLKDYFSEMTPIFKNVDVKIGDIGPFMKEFCEDPNSDCSFKGLYSI